MKTTATHDGVTMSSSNDGYLQSIEYYDNKLYLLQNDFVSIVNSYSTQNNTSKIIYIDLNTQPYSLTTVASTRIQGIYYNVFESETGNYNLRLSSFTIYNGFLYATELNPSILYGSGATWKFKINKFDLNNPSSYQNIYQENSGKYINNGNIVNVFTGTSSSSANWRFTRGIRRMICVNNNLFFLCGYENVRKQSPEQIYSPKTNRLAPGDNIYKIDLSSNAHTIFIGTETIIFPNYSNHCYSGSEFIVADDSSEVDSIMDSQNGEDINDCSFCHNIADFANDNQGNIYIFENTTAKTGYQDSSNLYHLDPNHYLYSNYTIKVLALRKINTNNKIEKVFNLSTSTSITDLDKTRYATSGKIRRTKLHIDNNNKLYINFCWYNGSTTLSTSNYSQGSAIFIKNLNSTGMPELLVGPNNTITNFNWDDYIQNMTSDASNNLYLLNAGYDANSIANCYLKEIIKISEE